MLASQNFGYLKAHDAKLAQLGALAERYFRDDPATCLVKLRQLAELLAKLIAARHALFEERSSFDDVLRRLSFERVLPREAGEIFYRIKKLGNAAVHEAAGTHADALSGLKFTRQLSIWFHRTYGSDPRFSPGAFVPPAEPVDATGPLRLEIEVLRVKVTEAEGLAALAKQEAEENARARESAEAGAARQSG